MLYELARHPQIQEEIRHEVQRVQYHSIDVVNDQCPLLDCALKETLRLHPAILENHHEVRRRLYSRPPSLMTKSPLQASQTISIPLDCPIPGTKATQVLIPKGTLLAIPLNVIHQDTKVWGPDAHIFNPDRWMERKRSQLRHKHELLTFSEG